MSLNVKKIRAIIGTVLGGYEDFNIELTTNPIGITVKVHATFNHVRLGGTFEFYIRYQQSPEEIASIIIHSFMETLIKQTVKTYEET